MTPRAWIVGQNEGAVLGEGWYGRSRDWFGLPYRESFPRATLLIDDLKARDRLCFLLSSCRALHTGRQEVRIGIGTETWVHWLPRPDTGNPWLPVSLAVPESAVRPGAQEILLQTEEWRHGTYESIPDFREVGFLFAGVFLLPR